MGCGNSDLKEDSRFAEKNHTIHESTIKNREDEFFEQKKIKNISEITIDPKKLVSSERNYQQIKKNYKVLEKIGTGSFGKVFKVFHIPSGQNRAMKVVKKEATKHQDDKRDNKKEFLKEIEVLTLLDHPNILKVLEYFLDDNNYYVVTELVNGGELFDHIQKIKHFSEEKACTVMIQILSAIRYLHSQGIVHRDLKLENILVDTSNDKDDLNIKIIDFGASNFYKKNLNLSLKIGTPYYIAPEVLEKSYNYKCDLWSCGVIMYILLSGSPPFDGRTDQEIMAKVKIGKYDFEKKIFELVSNEAKSLISQLLVLDPQKRITADIALNHAWIKKYERNDYSTSRTQNLKIERINNFQPKHKLQQTTIAFLVHQVASQKTNDHLKKIFQELDTKKNGRLYYNDLKEGLKKYSDLQLTDNQFETLLKQLDNDGNGYIEYEEFLRATMDMESLLTDSNLKMAFKFFDVDDSGKLDAEELKSVLGVMNDNPEHENDLINTILKDLKTEDGLISYENFKDIMRNACKEIVRKT